MNEQWNAKQPKRDHRRLALHVGTTLAVLALIGGLMAYAPGMQDVSPIVSPEAATVAPEKFVYFPSQYDLHAGPAEELPAQF